MAEMARIFPMIDGPAISWPLAQIIHEAAVASGGKDIGLQSLISTGGYRWSDVPRMFAVVRQRDKKLWRRLMDRSRELAMVIGDMELPPIANVPLPTAPPQILPSGDNDLGPLAVVCWKWNSTGFRVRYEAKHVNILAKMVKRHYKGKYKFVCICDDARGIDTNMVEVLPLWLDHSRVQNPNGAHLPSCFRRLKLFSKEMADQLKARRVVSLDLDVVITGDMSPLWDRSELFVGWRVPSASRTRYAFNGSMWMTVPGAYQDIWDKFDPVKSPQLAKAAQYFGSDQGWLSYYTQDMDLPGWTALDGVYSFPREVRPMGKLPRNARIVIFHGGRKPWEMREQRHHTWVGEHYG